MKSDDLKRPARPSLGTRRAMAQLAVAAAIVVIFLFVIWATSMADR